MIAGQGRYAVRVFDPASRAGSGFADLDAFPYDPDWVLPARFYPFAAERTVRLLRSVRGSDGSSNAPEARLPRPGGVSGAR